MMKVQINEFFLFDLYFPWHNEQSIHYDKNIIQLLYAYNCSRQLIIYFEKEKKRFRKPKEKINFCRGKLQKSTKERKS